MLTPDTLGTRLVLGVVLAALLALLVVRTIRRDRREYRRFTTFTATADRQRTLRKWLLESVLMLGGSAAIILLLAWQYVPRLLAAANRYPVLRELHGFVHGGGGVWSGIALGVVIGLAIGIVLVVVLLRNTKEVPTIGDISALLPRNREELVYGAGLSLNAGISEELLFRLAVPAVVFAVSGNALVALVASILLFSVLHLYQGISGIVSALVIGTLLMLLYLATGSILWPILAHVLFDLRSLVLIPVVVYRVHRKSGDDESRGPGSSMEESAAEESAAGPDTDQEVREETVEPS
jgi:membrane protease YdiL (CAAX protease family)